VAAAGGDVGEAGGEAEVEVGNENGQCCFSNDTPHFYVSKMGKTSALTSRTAD
jgi:hypothetical protein